MLDWYHSLFIFKKLYWLFVGLKFQYKFEISGKSSKIDIWQRFWSALCITR